MLKSDHIAKLLEDSQINPKDNSLFITPTPDLVKLGKSGSSSVDLRLGTWFATLRQARMSHLKIEEQAPFSRLAKMQYVSFGESYYLHPHSFVLGITMEWIRLPNSISGYIMGKSSWGRRGLIIATASSVHPGFKGCLTLELTNVGEIPIEIKPGVNICQLCLHTFEDGEVTLQVDESSYIGYRKPIMSKIKSDEIAKALASAYVYE